MLWIFIGDFVDF